MSSRKLPRHVHTPEELGQADYSQTIARDWIPQLDWARMAAETWADFCAHMGNIAWTYITATAANILSTIANWTNVIIAFGALTVSQITAILTNWTNLITALGNVAWAQVTKTAGDVVGTIANWTNIISSFGALTVGQILSILTSWTQMTNGSALGSFPIAKLDLPPYKLTTSAYNYVVNGGFEYDTWGGDETWSTTAKFGTHSIELLAITSNELSGYSNYIDIRGMDKVTLSAWIAIWNRTAGTFYASVYFYNSAKVALSPDHENWYSGTTDMGWTQETHTYTPSTDFPANTAYIRILFQWWAAGSPYCTGGANIDGVQINMGDQIPTFQDFTTYAYNWCPEKLETMLATELAWSNQTWTDILELGFECESTMLCLIFAHARGSVKKDSGTAEANAEYKLLLDDADISGTFGWIGKVEMAPDEILRGSYSSHSVIAVPKGTHTIKMQMTANIAGSTARAYDRRLSILKGFYQGGTT